MRICRREEKNGGDCRWMGCSWGRRGCVAVLFDFARKRELTVLFLVDSIRQLSHHRFASPFPLLPHLETHISYPVDSAAGATAFSCGLHTYNGAIGTTSSKSPCGTLLEAAKRQGFSTGLVTTSRLTHATPASFYAHVVDRDLESEIAEFLVDEAGTGMGLTVDFAMGGGRCFFLPNTTKGSCRTDGKDLLEKAKGKGLKVLEGMQALRTYHEEDAHDEGTVLGLFADDVRSSPPSFFKSGRTDIFLPRL